MTEKRKDIAGSAIDPETGNCLEVRQRSHLEKWRQLRDAKILIAEDFELNRNLFKTFLLHFASEVDTAENGLQALERIERNQTQDPNRPYDMIIMDIHMPVMDGLEATARLRANKQHCYLPIIGLSAVTMIDEPKEYGLDDFVRKPVDVDELLTVLTKWVNRQREY